MNSLELFLNKQNLVMPRFNHPKATSCADFNRLNLNLPGAQTKNLFLRDKQGKQHFLVVVPSHLEINLTSLSIALSVNRLGLASAERLQHFLKVAPGSVSVLSLVADKDKKVQLIIDESLWNEKAIQAHTMVNTETMIVSKSNLLKFLEATGHQARVFSVPSIASKTSEETLQ